MNGLLTKVLKDVISEGTKDSPYVFTSPRTGKAFRGIKNGFKRAVEEIGLAGGSDFTICGIHGVLGCVN
jgi:hypothetical protein